MNNTVDILTLIFDCKICVKEIKMFRGAVLSLFGDSVNVICHNHLDNSNFRYSYPLVQYKEIDGLAAVILLNDATSLLQDFYKKFPASISLGIKEVTLNLIKILPLSTRLELKDVKHQYSLLRWLPLNRENYKIYCSLESMTERISMLEKIIIGNILSMAKGLSITIEHEIAVTILSINKQYKVYNKNTPLLAFDVKFTCNMDLPDYIGLGKNSSIGYGVLKKQY